MADYIIRDAKPEDAARLAEIYSYYVDETAVSFEYTAPTAEEFGDRIRKITAKYPYLVCVRDGVAVGYAYASAYSSREAYSWTAAVSIYVDREYRQQGIGALLYAELEKRLCEIGIVNLLAGVAYADEEDEYLSHDSCKFHLRSGYTETAHLVTVGKKFDRWYDLIWYQKKIGDTDAG